MPEFLNRRIVTTARVAVGLTNAGGWDQGGGCLHMGQ